MPPSSSSLLFTWTFEATLLALVGLCLQSNALELWVTLTHLTVAGATAVLQIANSAACLDMQHDIAVSHLCLTTGLAVVVALAATDPVTAVAMWPNTLRRAFAVAYIGVQWLIGIGMTLASTQTPTALMFDAEGHVSVVWPLAIYLIGWTGHCLPSWAVGVLVGVVGILLCVMSGLGLRWAYHLVGFVLAAGLAVYEALAQYNLERVIFASVLGGTNLVWCIVSIVEKALEEPPKAPAPSAPPLPMITPAQRLQIRLKKS